jgi:hypothetical protein
LKAENEALKARNNRQDALISALKSRLDAMTRRENTKGIAMSHKGRDMEAARRNM